MKKIYITRSSSEQISSDLIEFTYKIKNFIECKIYPFEDDTYLQVGDDWENDIYSRISNCELIIALFEETISPNFYFEIGYAQGSGKKIILLAKENADIPEIFKKYLYFKFDSDKYELIAKSIANELSLTLEAKKKEDLINILQKTYSNTNYIHHYSFKDFEVKIKNLFEKKGFNCEYNPNKFDIGYDIFIKNYFENKNALIECKKYDLNKKVSLETVIQLLQELNLKNIDIGLIITTSTFTNSAIEFAKNLKEKKIELWDIARLEKEVSNYKS